MAEAETEPKLNGNGKGKTSGPFRSRSPDDAPIAPWPNFDRFPTVIGSSLTLAYISNVFRLATSGYRREYVDVLDELLERDPHAYAVLAQRVFGVAGGRLVIEPAECEESKKEDAEDVRAMVERELHRIPDLQQSIASLLWAIFYGVACCEIGWERDGEGWHVDRLFFVHSRRIQYPDPMSWGAHIWDWGMVRNWEKIGIDPTTARFGLKIDDWPGKFILHAPQLRGDYPTRDGLGREIAYWMAIKGMAARSGAQTVERFANPWAFGYWSTSDTGTPRAADDPDIKALNSALSALGSGLASAALPDSVKVVMERIMTSTRGGLIQTDWIDLCDKQIAIAVLGQTDTTDTGANGSRSAVEVRKQGSLELYRYDAACLSDSLERDLVVPLVLLNRPGQEKLTPRLRIVFEKNPTPPELMDLAAKAAASGVPVDADALAERIDLRVIPNENEGIPRRMAPLKQVDMFALDSGEPPAPPPSPVGAPAPDDDADEDVEEDEDSNG